MLKLKRAYAAPAEDDGFRILVDRLWPRGVAKVSAHIDLWFKDIAPSTQLRQWFGHDPAHWDLFRQRYFAELEQRPAAVAQLLAHIDDGPVTLIYGTKDEAHNHAVALKEFVERIRPRKARRPPAKQHKASR